INIHFFHRTATTQRIIFGAANSADELIERYKGFRLGYENVSLGINRLGLKLQYTAFGTRWQPATEFAARPLTLSGTTPTAGLSFVPGTDLYRSRQSLEPSMAFAFSPSLYATAG